MIQGWLTPWLQNHRRGLGGCGLTMGLEHPQVLVPMEGPGIHPLLPHMEKQLIVIMSMFSK